MTRAAYDRYVAGRSAPRAAVTEGVASRSDALAVNQVGGDDVWSSTEKLRLNYCISDRFGSRKQAVTTAMNGAAREWEAANVNFIYRPMQDADCNPSNTSVVFDVRPVSVGGAYLARAFFPHHARRDRNILIDDGTFGSGIRPYTLLGVLRHELGHVLGFRHEFTRPQAGICFEDNNWRPLTAYDPQSVMTFPRCGGTNPGDFMLSSRDILGAARIYGDGT